MTKDDVQMIVLTEIGNQWQRSNLHGVDLRRCLVTPEEVVTINVADEKEIKAWLILLECPDSRLGYAIVYEEKAQEFGLVQLAKDYQPCLIGLYGDFFDALEAM